MRSLPRELSLMTLRTFGQTWSKAVQHGLLSLVGGGPDRQAPPALHRPPSESLIGSDSRRHRLAGAVACCYHNIYHEFDRNLDHNGL